MDESETSQKALLDRFLADNDELEELTAELATFNVFRVLTIEEAEIRHSNTLGWLLDPAESHGLSDVFLSGPFSADQCAARSLLSTKVLVREVE